MPIRFISVILYFTFVLSGCATHYPHHQVTEQEINRTQGMILLTAHASWHGIPSFDVKINKSGERLFPLRLAINNTFFLSDYDDHMGLLHMRMLEPGKYTLRVSPTDSVHFSAKYKDCEPEFNFEILAGEKIYLGDIHVEMEDSQFRTWVGGDWDYNQPIYQRIYPALVFTDVKKSIIQMSCSK